MLKATGLEFPDATPLAPHGLGGLIRDSFSNGRLSATLGAHGGLLDISYCGCQHLGAFKFFKGDPGTSWTKLFRASVGIGADRHYLPMRETCLYPFGCTGRAEAAGIAWEQQLLLLPDALVQRFRVMDNPEKRPVCIEMSHQEPMVAVSGANRRWLPFAFEPESNAIITCCTDENPNVYRGAGSIYQSSLGLEVRDAPHAETWIGVGCNLPMTAKFVHAASSGQHFKIYLTSAAAADVQPSFFLVFAASRDELLRRLRELATTVDAECDALLGGYEQRLKTRPQITLGDPVLDSAFAQFPEVLEQSKIPDRRGATKATNQGYFVWGWDGLTPVISSCLANEPEYAAAILRFFHEARHPRFGIVHQFTTSFDLKLAMVYPAQALYMASLYHYYATTGDLELVREVMPTCTFILDRCRENEIGRTGLVTGTGFWPDKLDAGTRRLLERYARLNIPYMSTPDLQVFGYNDNHPYKAFHTLIVGGEMFDLPAYVELGVRRLREALGLLGRNGLPCEYNSPTYTPVSLQPLASIVEQARSVEARELALELEQFYWRDLALHFDPRAGVPAGPHSRAYVDGYSGLLSNLLGLLAYLFPERFDTDLVTEVYGRGEQSDLCDFSFGHGYPFWTAHYAWLARAEFHLPDRIEETIFDKPAGSRVRGMVETGSWSINWKPEEKPEGSPSTMRLGPRRSLCTTYFGRRYSLGTAQFSWLNNAQADGFHAAVARGSGRDPRGAAVYFSRMFFDERSPYGENPFGSHSFQDDGDIRCVQHDNTALVLYNPHPLFGTFKRLRLGLYRPLLFSRPEELWVGNVRVPDLNYLSGRLAPVAIRDGAVYIGFIPLRLTDHGQARAAHLHVHTYSDRLAILMSSFEGWEPRAFPFEDIVATNAGFVCEMRDAEDFASFAEFRDWLAAARVEDQYDLSHRRLTTYRRAGLTLSARYSPFQTGFQHATVNGEMVEMPRIAVEGLRDPGAALPPEAAESA